jgi:mycothiol synthase
METQLPNGYTARPATMDDIPVTVDLINAFFHQWLKENMVDSTTLELEWKAEPFNIETDTRVVLDPNGAMVGLGEFGDHGSKHVSFYTFIVLHPAHYGCGIEEHLMEWAIDRARQNQSKAPEGARVVLKRFELSQNQVSAAVLKRLGFELIRNSYQMRIEFTDPPQPAQLPDGIVIRCANGGDDQREAISTAHESFRDHFGFVDEPFEAVYARWQDWIKNDPHHDPTLWYMAMDGEAVAGVSICHWHEPEDPDMGWIGTLGVRREWRKRGVGLALLQHSFYDLHQRGKKRAGLSVDASSLTGATRLYERAGMYVHRKHDLYELEIRPGVDLTTRDL